MEMSSTLLDFPDEVLLMICSLLPMGDALSVRNTCRRLRGVGSDPSLWHAIALSYHGPRDDPRLASVLNLSVPHTRKFSITDATQFSPTERPISKFLPLLKRSPSVTSVSLYGYEITYEQLKDIVSALPCLVDLKVPLSFETESKAVTALRLTSHLQSLVITYPIIKTRPISTLPWDSSEEQEKFISVWSCRAKYNPPELGLQSGSSSWVFSETRTIEHLNFPPTKHKARLSLYGPPLAFARLPDYPSTTVEFIPSKPPSIPYVQLCPVFRVSRNSQQLILTDNRSGCYDYHTGRSSCSTPIPFGVPVSVNFPSSLTHLYFFCTGLSSASLEVIAEQCPRLTRLSLYNCSDVLQELCGLNSIAAHCRLEDLNIANIASYNVECIDSLWDILGRMHLLRLAVDICMLTPQAARIPALLPHVAAQPQCESMTSLTAVELGFVLSCSDCTLYYQPEATPFSMCTSLEYLRVSYLEYCSFLPGLLERFRHLKYLYLNVGTLSLPSSETCYSCLEQLYIRSAKSTLTEDIITAITSGGKITHAYLDVQSIDEELVLHFIRNSPRLVTFCVVASEDVLCKLRSITKSCGVLDFKMPRYIRRQELFYTKLLPLFCCYSTSK